MDVGVEQRVGQFVLYDWKCYREDGRFAEYDQQLFKHQLTTYALGPVRRERAPTDIGNVVAWAFNPVSGESLEMRFTEEDLADFELEVGRWMRVRSQVFTSVTEVDFADLAGPREPERSCPWCSLKAACGREIAWHQLT